MSTALQLSPYLSFAGNCAEAMRFYQQCLGGELHIQPFAGTPAAEYVPAEAQQQVLHARLTSPGLVLMASDGGGTREPFVPGNGVALCLNCGSDAEITELFAKLAAGGTVLDPLADMFWGGKFGALTDRFGVRWLLNHDQTAH